MLANVDCYVALKRATEDREGWKQKERMSETCSTAETIEGLCERTEHVDIFLFSTHHSMVFYFQCSVY